jgi:EAL domain-containing protein (putative c-di-GMP-specific phosphodiesterase class I)
VLELEITETTAMVDPVRSLVVLGELHALGVKLALDDYGTGHSSLAYLNELPVDTLKIDRSFVRTMDASSQGATIVRSTIDLARNLGLTVVAEGVETEEAWHLLSDLACDSAQGYWLARPEPAETLLALVARLEERLATVRRDVPTPA